MHIAFARRIRLAAIAVFPIAAFAMSFAMSFAAASTQAPGVPRGTMLRLTMVAPSLGEYARRVRVYLPPSYSTPADSAKRYPVVFMLHGWPGSEGNLPGGGRAAETADSLIARGAIPEIIMVFPRGHGEGFAGRSYWINALDGKKQLEDYLTRDLVDWVDRNYRTIPSASARGVIGISDGGTAACNLAFKHPELFSACGSHSADYVLERAFGTGGFLGRGPESQRLLEANSPALYAGQIVPQLLGERIYFDCGLGDGSIKSSRSFDSLLTRLGVPHEYHEYPGSHTWGYWRLHLKQSLAAVAGALH